MTDSMRPKRVVVAENTLREISGDFYWLDDHDRIVSQARESAYAQGYADGVVAAARRSKHTHRLGRGSGRINLGARPWS